MERCGRKPRGARSHQEPAEAGRTLPRAFAGTALDTLSWDSGLWNSERIIHVALSYRVRGDVLQQP